MTSERYKLYHAELQVEHHHQVVLVQWRFEQPIRMTYVSGALDVEPVCGAIMIGGLVERFRSIERANQALRTEELKTAHLKRRGFFTDGWSLEMQPPASLFPLPLRVGCGVYVPLPEAKKNQEQIHVPPPAMTCTAQTKAGGSITVKETWK